MPKFEIYDEDSGNYVELEYATEEEVLEFANKLRAAGAAEPLDALMPSRRNDATECLIANACNFGCEVRPWEAMKGDWFLQFPSNMSSQKCLKIMHAVGCEPHEGVAGDVVRLVPAAVAAMALPERIGNAAMAFDHGEGWTRKYA